MPTDCYGIVSELAGTADKADACARLQIDHLELEERPGRPGAGAEAAPRTKPKRSPRALYASYAATLKAYQAVDFDDLIRLPVELSSSTRRSLDKWQNRLRYLLVDEYQDTNACQYQLLKLLAGPRAAFTAVGDDDQAIYGWRGADIENLRRLAARLSESEADQARTELPLDRAHPARPPTR